MSWITHDDDDQPYADYEVRQRPNPKGTKPRTKIRPDHDDAVPGRILSVDRGRYPTLIDEGSPDERTIVATRARELRKQAIVTGDRVDVVADTSGEDGTLSRIVRIQPRTTVL